MNTILTIKYYILGVKIHQNNVIPLNMVVSICMSPIIGYHCDNGDMSIFEIYYNIIHRWQNEVIHFSV